MSSCSFTYLSFFLSVYLLDFLPVSDVLLSLILTYSSFSLSTMSVSLPTRLSLCLPCLIVCLPFRISPCLFCLIVYLPTRLSLCLLCMSVDLLVFLLVYTMCVCLTLSNMSCYLSLSLSFSLVSLNVRLAADSAFCWTMFKRCCAWCRQNLNWVEKMWVWKF